MPEPPPTLPLLLFTDVITDEADTLLLLLLLLEIIGVDDSIKSALQFQNHFILFFYFSSNSIWKKLIPVIETVGDACVLREIIGRNDTTSAIIHSGGGGGGSNSRHKR